MTKEVSVPAAYVQYFVCGVKTDCEGLLDSSEDGVRFFGANGSAWYPNPDNATRCNKTQALEYLTQKQNVVGSDHKENFFIVRADVTLTRVKVNLVDYVKE